MELEFIFYFYKIGTIPNFPEIIRKTSVWYRSILIFWKTSNPIVNLTKIKPSEYRLL